MQPHDDRNQQRVVVVIRLHASPFIGSVDRNYNWGKNRLTLLQGIRFVRHRVSSMGLDTSGRAPFYSTLRSRIHVENCHA